MPVSNQLCYFSKISIWLALKSHTRHQLLHTYFYQFTTNYIFFLAFIINSDKFRDFSPPPPPPPKKKKKKKQIKKIVFKDGGEEYRRLFKYSSIQGRDSARGHHVKMFILVQRHSIIYYIIHIYKGLAAMKKVDKNEHYLLCIGSILVLTLTFTTFFFLVW